MGHAEDLFAAWMAEVGLTGDPELGRTAERVTELFRELSPPPAVIGTFALAGSGPVAVTALPFHSLCAHHLLPFFGTADLIYRPRDRVAGFSDLARAVDVRARRPQLQERLAQQLADDLVAALDPIGLVVRLTARQLCMEMRGARATAQVVTLAERGEAGPLRALLP